MTMITPSYLGETIEYSSLHACRSTLEDPTVRSVGCAPCRYGFIQILCRNRKMLGLPWLCIFLGPAFQDHDTRQQ